MYFLYELGAFEIRNLQTTLAKTGRFRTDYALPPGSESSCSVLTRLTLRKTKKKTSWLAFVAQWYFRHWDAVEPIIQNASLASTSQPDVVSQVVVAYARGDR
jgi:hypothetical protein